MIEPLHSSITINYHETATSSITDLTGTKWVIKKPSEIVGTLSAESPSIMDTELTYKIYASTYESAEQNNIRIREFYNSGIYAGGIVASISPFVYPRIILNTVDGVQYNTDSSTYTNIGDIESTIEITGGTGVTNSDLIAWLQANATQIQEQPNTFSFGNLPIENVYFGTQQVKKIYLGNTLVWEKEENANLISFKVDSIPYQAESNMTWQEWVNSAYNTNGYKVVGSGIYTADNQYYVANVLPSDKIRPNGSYWYTNAGGGSDN